MVGMGEGEKGGGGDSKTSSGDTKWMTFPLTTIGSARD